MCCIKRLRLSSSRSLSYPFLLSSVPPLYSPFMGLRTSPFIAILASIPLERISDTSSLLHVLHSLAWFPFLPLMFLLSLFISGTNIFDPLVLLSMTAIRVLSRCPQGCPVPSSDTLTRVPPYPAITLPILISYDRSRFHSIPRRSPRHTSHRTIPLTEDALGQPVLKS